jgi:hypothetical protein
VPFDSDAGRIALRVRIGVVGHRVVDNPEAVAAAARDLVTALCAEIGGVAATEVVFTVLSALAEGSDRILADAMLAALPKGSAELEVVLPFAQHEYEKDFADSDSVKRFRELLHRAGDRVTTFARARRPEGYEQAGRRIVDSCDVLIAVWDQLPANGPGGTAEIVAAADRNSVPVVVITPDGAIPNANRPILGKDVAEAARRVSELNQLSFADRRLHARVDGEAARFMAVVGDSPVHWRADALARWALPAFARADCLAMRYQARYRFLGWSVYIAAATAVGVVAWQELLTDGHIVFSAIEVGLMLYMLGCIAYSRRQRPHERWLGYRSLAEALRGALFIALTGFQERPAREHATQQPAAAEPWHQRAFSEVWRMRATRMPEMTRDEGIDVGRILADGWLIGQIEYHGKTGLGFLRRRRVLDRSIIGLFAVTLLAAFLHLLNVGHDAVIYGERTWSDVFVLLAITLPALGAALSGIRDQRQYRLHEERSRSMTVRLDRIRRSIETETSPKVIRKHAADAQRIMAEENVEWSGVLEFQDIEITL